ncbi:MAG: hypothetical protein NVS9B6_06570 [Candidatus Limnocylindrales bacterium]
MLSALTLVGIAGSVGSGPLADLWSARATLVGVDVVRALALPLVAVALWTGATWLLFVFAIAFGLTYIANHAPAIRLLRARSEPAEATRRLGWLQLVHQLGGAAGVLAGGASVALAGGYRRCSSSRPRSPPPLPWSACARAEHLVGEASEDREDFRR